MITITTHVTYEFHYQVKEIEGSDFFPQLDLNNRLLTFEMLTAAETRNLKLLFDRLGYIVLLEYIDGESFKGLYDL